MAVHASYLRTANFLFVCHSITNHQADLVFPSFGSLTLRPLPN